MDENHNWACRDKLIKPKVDESPMVIILLKIVFFFLENPKIHFNTCEASRKKMRKKKKKKSENLYTPFKWCDNLKSSSGTLITYSTKHTNTNRESHPQLFQSPFLHCNIKLFRSLLYNNRLFRRWACFFFYSITIPICL